MNLQPLFILLSKVFIVLDLHGTYAEKTCSKNCKPLIQEKIHCDENTGECSEGCNTGYYGTTCDKPCQCGGGTCEFLDGTCIGTPTVTPEAVSQGCVSDTEVSNGLVFPVVVCCLCLLVVILTLLVIFNGKEEILKICKRQDQLRHGEDYPLMTRPDQNHPLTDSKKNLLLDKLGVHFLNNKGTEPVVLHCACLQFDYHRINRAESSLMKDQILSNEPAPPGKEFQVGFKKFSGTTSLYPISPSDIPTYFEIDAYVHLKKVLGETDLLMSVGLCSENHRDQGYQLKLGDHCYSLIVGPYKDQIFTNIYRENFPDGIKNVTDLENKAGEGGHLHYGILIDRSKDAIVFFDVAKTNCLECFDKVDIKKKDYELGPLWPMFGVYSQSYAEVSMKLIKGREVKMTPAKTNMILSVLKSLK